MMDRSEILTTMGELKLYGMKSAYDEIITSAVKRQHQPERIVGDLLAAEIAEKQARSIKYQMTIAKLPLAKDIEDFDFTGTGINDTLVKDLAAGHFLAHERNVVLIGGTGTGKTHLAITIARAAIRNGARGRFFNVLDLVNKLEAETRAGRQGHEVIIGQQLFARDGAMLRERLIAIVENRLRQRHGDSRAQEVEHDHLALQPLARRRVARKLEDQPVIFERNAVPAIGERDKARACHLWQPRDDQRAIAALVLHEEVEERTAASLLLAAYWAFQCDDSDLDRYHWLNDTAYLDVGDVEVGRDENGIPR